MPVCVRLVLVAAVVCAFCSTARAQSPYSWSSEDVGAVGIAGDASASGGTYTVSGAGSDIWGTADSFHFVDRPFNDDSSIQARVTGITNTGTYAKAGVMFRKSSDPSAATALLDIKPDGGVEFMVRSAAQQEMSFVVGTSVQMPASLKLQLITARVNSIAVAYVRGAGDVDWTQIGYAYVAVGNQGVGGLAVTSHDLNRLNTSTFDSVQMSTNLLQESSFEDYNPPDLGPPGWVSDNPLRVIPAKSEYNQPHNGAKDGACWATTDDDCGIYQEMIAPETATYTFTIFANADRPGGLVGANVNGATVVTTNVPVRGFGNYGSQPLSMSFTASAGDMIRVWMYSPPVPGYVVIDDAALYEAFP